MIVSTAIHSGLLSGEIVGLRKAGRAAATCASFAFGRLNLRPTMCWAARAPCSISTICSIFARLAGLAQAALLAMRTVVVSMSWATMRSLLALIEEPVSVMSTIASASSGTFTSVAPQENSTSHSMPCALNQRRVVSTSSVATRLPARSLAVWTGEASGTQRTQRDFWAEARL